MGRTAQPAAPAKAAYSFGNLFEAPRRLLRSPSLNSVDATQYQRIGLVRTLFSTPIFHVKLDDVLANKVQPPMTLREFEDWILFHEHAPESLYFHFWLRDYRIKFGRFLANRSRTDVTRWSPPTRANTPAELVKQFDEGIRLFTAPASSLELNLPGEIKHALKLDAQATIDPSIFDAAYACARDSLEESLRALGCRVARGNADRNRGRTAIGLGIATVLLSFVPFAVAVALHLSRAWRVFFVPLCWLGIVLAVGGYGQTCLVIFLFAGPARQLHTYEYARRQAFEKLGKSPASPGPRPLPTYQHSGLSRRSTQVEEKTPEPELVVTLSSDPRPRCATTDSDVTTYTLPMGRVEGAEAEAEGEKANESVESLFYFRLASDGRSDTNSSTTDVSIVPWAGADDSTLASVPTWSGLTPVSEPGVVWAQRRRLINGAAYATITTALLSAIVFAVPNA